MLQVYRNKVSTSEEGIYRNVLALVLMFRCQTNTLKLRWRNRFSNEAVDCLLCGAVEETSGAFCDGVRWTEGD